MLMDQYKKWLQGDNKSSLGSEDSEENFGIFYQTYTFGRTSFMEMMADLAYQVYEIQVCVEGLIEDQNQ